MAKKIIAIIITACTLLSLLSPTATAENESKNPLSAEITEVYGGREGIVSMTFDDGYYETALLLDELFEEYDLYGSLMLIANHSINQRVEYASQSEWLELFANGRLEPQNHSADHLALHHLGDPQLQTEAVFESEMLDSKITLSSYFPEYDFISYAIPYGNMTDAAHEYCTDLYYAIRATTPGVQSLDPDTTSESGSWYKMHSPPVMYDQYHGDPDAQWEWIKKCIDDAKSDWYLPIIHRVGDEISTDLPLEVAHKMFSYIHELDSEGVVWVTTYSNAIKYVRERQNSTVEAWESDGEILVRVTMNEYTEGDNKPLPLDVFDHPLTVKVAVPDEIGSVYYTTGAKEYSAESFSDGGKRYVYVNLVPDGSEVKLRRGSTHTYGEIEKYDETYHKEVCTDCGVENFIPHSWDEGIVITEATCTENGSNKCTCIDCGEVAEIETETNDNHDFSKPDLLYAGERANCKHANLFYYTCSRCRAKGTETFEQGEKKDHDFGKWETVENATETEDGYKERVCKECGDTEREILPKTKADEKTDELPLPLIIGISAGVLLAVIAVGAVIIFIKRRNS